FDRSRTGNVTHGTEPHLLLQHKILFVHVQIRRSRHQPAIPYNTIPFMGKVNFRYGNLFTLYIIPDILFSPVTDGKYPHILSLPDTSVIYVPQFRALPLRFPLPEFITHRKYTFLCTGLFLITPGTANTGIKAIGSDDIQQRDGL